MKGSNLNLVNTWFSQLGIPEESGYFGWGDNLVVGFDYTGGTQIRYSIVDRGDDSGINGVDSPDLRHDFLLMATEAGIDIALFWNGRAKRYEVCWPNEIP